MTQPPPAIITAARASAAKWKIPASVSLAQWAIESGWGKRNSGVNNPFGITAPLNAQHRPMVPATDVTTHEEVHGVRIATSRWFRNFDTVEAAFDYHAKLLATSGYYKAAMAALPNVERFVGLMAQHYASDSHYAASVMAVIRGSALAKYDT